MITSVMDSKWTFVRMQAELQAVPTPGRTFICTSADPTGPGPSWGPGPLTG